VSQRIDFTDILDESSQFVYLFFFYPYSIIKIVCARQFSARLRASSQPGDGSWRGRYQIGLVVCVASADGSRIAVRLAGLGTIADDGRELNDRVQMIALMLVIVAFGLVIDRVIVVPIES
jgi:hypothetical protein